MSIRDLPTKNNLIKLQNFINQSKQGHKLLEQKKLILTRELDKYKEKEKELKEKGKNILKEAQNSLRLSNVDIGIESMINLSNTIKEDDNVIDIKYKTIMGVEIPSIISQENEIAPVYGLYNTTSNIDETIIKYNKLKKYIIELAEIENIIFRLEKSIEKVQRRANALKEIIIPRDEKTAKKIQEILDETDIEEFSRMKIIKK
ncbi:MAG: V-type ATP synthase subunit D [Clostridia bacterium]|nr:V-type ATP synthase subunit D [Clostridia bacterium]